MRLKIKKNNNKIVEDTHYDRPMPIVYIIYCISVFRERTYNYYAIDDIVNSVPGFIILFYMQTLFEKSVL